MKFKDANGEDPGAPGDRGRARALPPCECHLQLRQRAPVARLLAVAGDSLPRFSRSGRKSGEALDALAAVEDDHVTERGPKIEGHTPGSPVSSAYARWRFEGNHWGGGRHPRPPPQHLVVTASATPGELTVEGG